MASSNKQSLRRFGWQVSVGILTSLLSVGVPAEEDERKLARQISLQGILGNKALLFVDGQRQMMSTNDAEKNGVRLLRILEDQAEVLIDGKRKRLRLGDSYSVARKFKARKTTEVVIPKNSRGMYTSVGSINGLPVTFLVDTGATSIAMNEQQAKRLAIDFRVKGNPTFVGTASGVSKAFRVTLDKVTLGGITQHNVVAVVIEGGFPVDTLLGMSFLGQLQIEREGNIMRLTQKH